MCSAPGYTRLASNYSALEVPDWSSAVQHSDQRPLSLANRAVYQYSNLTFKIDDVSNPYRGKAFFFFQYVLSSFYRPDLRMPFFFPEVPVQSLPERRRKCKEGLLQGG